jgi:hypothetical protein
MKGLYLSSQCAQAHLGHPFSSEKTLVQLSPPGFMFADQHLDVFIKFFLEFPFPENLP